MLFTHSHADHILGLDDIRRFNFMQGGADPLLRDGGRLGEHPADVLLRLRRRRRGRAAAFPGLTRTRSPGRSTSAGVRVVPVPLLHGRMPILGFRFGNFAYLTDCSAIPDESWPLVAGVETLVIDALRDKKHATHFTVDEALEAIARIAPRPRLPDAHVARSGARRDQRASARGRRTGI